MADSNARTSRIKTIVYALVPLIALGLLVALFLLRGESITEPITRGGENLPSPESITFERIVFKPSQIVAYVRNSGPESVTIAGVHVNDMATRAYISPSADIPRLRTATVTIPHDWVEGDPYDIRIVTSTGLFHSDMVDIASLTPMASPNSFAVFALLGIYVGVIPVFLGLAWYPALRRASKKVTRFLLAFTVGLLVFLGLDALIEALEVAAGIAQPLQPIMLTVIATVATFFLISLVANWMARRTAGAGAGHSALGLAMLIAIGIGFHNFGEGLAIGAAYALGEAALGGVLVLGFTIHNTTEGIAIVTPLTQADVKLRHFVLMGLVAGAPTILGAWIGGFAYSPILSLIFLGVGAGAVLQVIHAVMGSYERPAETLLRPVFGSGIVAGFALMYATSLLIP